MNEQVSQDQVPHKGESIIENRKNRETVTNHDSPHR